MMTADVLGKLKWTGKLNGCEIVIRHRGAKNDEKVISGSNVTGIKKTYFLYKNGRETFIPMHRVLIIRLYGKTIWERVIKQRGKEA